MRLVAVEEGGAADGDALPLDYDPEAIEEYWGRRPVAVASRVLQVGGRGRAPGGLRRCVCSAAGACVAACWGAVQLQHVAGSYRGTAW